MRNIAAAAAILVASTVASSAADLAVKAPPMVAPAPVWTWTGFYIGAHVGAGWGETESTLTGATFSPPPTTVAFQFPFSQNSRSGFLGGGQIGYNWQAGWAVFGVQGDIAAANIEGTNPCLILLSCTSDSDWLATVSGRLGAVVLDRGLVYVKGGAAWLNTQHSVDFLPIAAAAIPGVNITNKESTSWGWMVGFGTEWQITPNWTAFVEYNYIKFDDKNEAFAINPLLLPAGASLTVNADLKNTLSIAKVGVNYKFNWQ